eukprot:TRINITY_DN275_c0_g2_i1.p1 TRINITY_DN275_c0_g2~~TRINITY_DN275_c0_g2_i1.p1  ORF type:complete len:513 (-),score=225.51 TRINITY_DN275_c0_g2_i1:104-1642(-)
MIENIIENIIDSILPIFIILFKLLLSIVFLIIGYIICRFMFFIIRYQIVKHKYKHLPRLNNSICPFFEFFSETGGLEKFLNSLFDKNGETVPIQFLGPYIDGTNFVAISDPEAIREVLVNEEKFPKHPKLYSLFEEIIGKGLVISNGELWKRERKVLTPLFHFGRLKNYVPIILQHSLSTVQRLRENNSQPFKFVPLMNDFTLNVIIDVAFGGDFDANWMYHTWESLLKNLSYFSIWQILIGPKLVNYLPLPSKNGLFKAKKMIEKKVAKAIEKRVKEIENSNGNCEFNDLLGTLILAKDSQGNSTPLKIIVDECLTFLFAGHDTTSNLLSWAIFEIGQHPDVYAKLVKEVDSILIDENSITNEQIEKLNYTKQTLLETLRLHQPVPNVDRLVKEDCYLANQFISKGTAIAIFFSCVHLDPKYWQQPTLFKPERFAQEEIEDRKNFSFLPFSGGPRNCIGQRFALQEAKILLAFLIRNFSFEIINPEKVIGVLKGTMTPANLIVRAIPRKSI